MKIKRPLWMKALTKLVVMICRFGIWAGQHVEDIELRRQRRGGAVDWEAMRVSCENIREMKSNLTKLRAQLEDRF